MPGAMTRSLVGWFGVLLFSLGLACDDPAHDLSEWTPADHTHQTEKSGKAAQAQQRRQGPLGKPATYTPPSKRGGTLLVDVTWVKQCANCHGKRGRGDRRPLRPSLPPGLELAHVLTVTALCRVAS